MADDIQEPTHNAGQVEGVINLDLNEAPVVAQVDDLERKLKAAAPRIAASALNILNSLRSSVIDGITDVEVYARAIEALSAGAVLGGTKARGPVFSQAERLAKQIGLDSVEGVNEVRMALRKAAKKQAVAFAEELAGDAFRPGVLAGQPIRQGALGEGIRRIALADVLTVREALDDARTTMGRYVIRYRSAISDVVTDQGQIDSLVTATIATTSRRALERRKQALDETRLEMRKQLVEIQAFRQDVKQTAAFDTAETNRLLQSNVQLRASVDPVRTNRNSTGSVVPFVDTSDPTEVLDALDKAALRTKLRLSALGTEASDVNRQLGLLGDIKLDGTLERQLIGLDTAVSKLTGTKLGKVPLEELLARVRQLKSGLDIGIPPALLAPTFKDVVSLQQAALNSSPIFEAVNRGIGPSNQVQRASFNLSTDIGDIDKVIADLEAKRALMFQAEKRIDSQVTGIVGVASRLAGETGLASMEPAFEAWADSVAAVTNTAAVTTRGAEAFKDRLKSRSSRALGFIAETGGSPEALRIKLEGVQGDIPNVRAKIDAQSEAVDFIRKRLAEPDLGNTSKVRLSDALANLVGGKLSNGQQAAKVQLEISRNELLGLMADEVALRHAVQFLEHETATTLGVGTGDVVRATGAAQAIVRSRQEQARIDAVREQQLRSSRISQTSSADVFGQDEFDLQKEEALNRQRIDRANRLMGLAVEDSKPLNAQTGPRSAQAQAARISKLEADLAAARLDFDAANADLGKAGGDVARSAELVQKRAEAAARFISTQRLLEASSTEGPLIKVFQSGLKAVARESAAQADPVFDAAIRLAASQLDRRRTQAGVNSQIVRQARDLVETIAPAGGVEADAAGRAERERLFAEGVRSAVASSRDKAEPRVAGMPLSEAVGIVTSVQRTSLPERSLRIAAASRERIAAALEGVGSDKVLGLGDIGSLVRELDATRATIAGLETKGDKGSQASILAALLRSKFNMDKALGLQVRQRLAEVKALDDQAARLKTDAGQESGGARARLLAQAGVLEQKALDLKAEADAKLVKAGELFIARGVESPFLSGGERTQLEQSRKSEADLLGRINAVASRVGIFGAHNEVLHNLLAAATGTDIAHVAIVAAARNAPVIEHSIEAAIHEVEQQGFADTALATEFGKKSQFDTNRVRAVSTGVISAAQLKKVLIDQGGSVGDLRPASRIASSVDPRFPRGQSERNAELQNNMLDEIALIDADIAQERARGADVDLKAINKLNKARSNLGVVLERLKAADALRQRQLPSPDFIGPTAPTIQTHAQLKSDRAAEIERGLLEAFRINPAVTADILASRGPKSDQEVGEQAKRALSSILAGLFGLTPGVPGKRDSAGNVVGKNASFAPLSVELGKQLKVKAFGTGKAAEATDEQVAAILASMNQGLDKSEGQVPAKLSDARLIAGMVVRARKFLSPGGNPNRQTDFERVVQRAADDLEHQIKEAGSEIDKTGVTPKLDIAGGEQLGAKSLVQIIAKTNFGGSSDGINNVLFTAFGEFVESRLAILRKAAFNPSAARKLIDAEFGRVASFQPNLSDQGLSLVGRGVANPGELQRVEKVGEVTSGSVLLNAADSKALNARAVSRTRKIRELREAQVRAQEVRDLAGELLRAEGRNLDGEERALNSLLSVLGAEGAPDLAREMGRLLTVEAARLIENDAIENHDVRVHRLSGRLLALARTRVSAAPAAAANVEEVEKIQATQLAAQVAQDVTVAQEARKEVGKLALLGTNALDPKKVPSLLEDPRLKGVISSASSILLDTTQGSIGEVFAKSLADRFEGPITAARAFLESVGFNKDGTPMRKPGKDAHLFTLPRNAAGGEKAAAIAQEADTMVALWEKSFTDVADFTKLPQAEQNLMRDIGAFVVAQEKLGKGAKDLQVFITRRGEIVREATREELLQAQEFEVAKKRADFARSAIPRAKTQTVVGGVPTGPEGVIGQFPPVDRKALFFGLEKGLVDVAKTSVHLAVNTGVQLADGVLEGWRDGMEHGRRIFGETIESVLHAVRRDQEIKSPSKRWADLLGEPLAAGTAAGFVGFDLSGKILANVNAVLRQIEEAVSRGHLTGLEATGRKRDVLTTVANMFKESLSASNASIGAGVASGLSPDEIQALKDTHKQIRLAKVAFETAFPDAAPGRQPGLVGLEHILDRLARPAVVPVPAGIGTGVGAAPAARGDGQLLGRALAQGMLVGFEGFDLQDEVISDISEMLHRLRLAVNAGLVTDARAAANTLVHDVLKDVDEAINIATTGLAGAVGPQVEAFSKKLAQLRTTRSALTTAFPDALTGSTLPVDRVLGNLSTVSDLQKSAAGRNQLESLQTLTRAREAVRELATQLQALNVAYQSLIIEQGALDDSIKRGQLSGPQAREAAKVEQQLAKAVQEVHAQRQKVLGDLQAQSNLERSLAGKAGQKSDAESIKAGIVDDNLSQAQATVIAQAEVNKVLAAQDRTVTGLSRSFELLFRARQALRNFPENTSAALSSTAVSALSPQKATVANAVDVGRQQADTLDRVTARYLAQKAAAAELQRQLEGLRSAQAKLEASIGPSGPSGAQVASFKSMQREAATLQKQIGTLEKATLSYEQTGTHAWAAHIPLIKKFVQTQEEANTSTQRFTRIGGLAQGVIGGLIGSATLHAQNVFAGGIRGIGDALVGFNARIEQSRVGIDVFTKSQAESNKLISDLVNLAAGTTLNFEGVLNGTKRLLAMGVAASEILPTFRVLGAAVAAVGGQNQTETLDRVILAYGQIRAKNVLISQDLRQLAEAGIPAFAILQQKLGLTASQVFDIGRQSINSKVGVAALLEGLQELYGGTLLTQLDTFVGRQKNLTDLLQIFVGKAGADFTKELKIAFRDLGNILQDPGTLQAASVLGKSLGQAMKQIREATVSGQDGILLFARTLPTNLAAIGAQLKQFQLFISGLNFNLNPFSGPFLFDTSKADLAAGFSEVEAAIQAEANAKAHESARLGAVTIKIEPVIEAKFAELKTAKGDLLQQDLNKILSAQKLQVPLEANLDLSFDKLDPKAQAGATKAAKAVLDALDRALSSFSGSGRPVASIESNVLSGFLQQVALLGDSPTMDKAQAGVTQLNALLDGLHGQFNDDNVKQLIDSELLLVAATDKLNRVQKEYTDLQTRDQAASTAEQNRIDALTISLGKEEKARKAASDAAKLQIQQIQNQTDDIRFGQRLQDHTFDVQINALQAVGQAFKELHDPEIQSLKDAKDNVDLAVSRLQTAQAAVTTSQQLGIDSQQRVIRDITDLRTSKEEEYKQKIDDATDAETRHSAVLKDAQDDLREAVRLQDEELNRIDLKYRAELRAKNAAVRTDDRALKLANLEFDKHALELEEQIQAARRAGDKGREKALRDKLSADRTDFDESVAAKRAQLQLDQDAADLASQTAADEKQAAQDRKDDINLKGGERIDQLTREQEGLAANKQALVDERDATLAGFDAKIKIANAFLLLLQRNKDDTDILQKRELTNMQALATAAQDRLDAETKIYDNFNKNNDKMVTGLQALKSAFDLSAAEKLFPLETQITTLGRAEANTQAQFDATHKDTRDLIDTLTADHKTADDSRKVNEERAKKTVDDADQTVKDLDSLVTSATNQTELVAAVKKLAEAASGEQTVATPAGAGDTRTDKQKILAVIGAPLFDENGRQIRGQQDRLAQLAKIQDDLLHSVPGAVEALQKFILELAPLLSSHPDTASILPAQILAALLPTVPDKTQVGVSVDVVQFINLLTKGLTQDANNFLATRTPAQLQKFLEELKLAIHGDRDLGLTGVEFVRKTLAEHLADFPSNSGIAEGLRKALLLDSAGNIDQAAVAQSQADAAAAALLDPAIKLGTAGDTLNDAGNKLLELAGAQRDKDFPLPQRTADLLNNLFANSGTAVDKNTAHLTDEFNPPATGPFAGVANIGRNSKIDTLAQNIAILLSTPRGIAELKKALALHPDEAKLLVDTLKSGGNDTAVRLRQAVDAAHPGTTVLGALEKLVSDLVASGDKAAPVVKASAKKVLDGFSGGVTEGSPAVATAAQKGLTGAVTTGAAAAVPTMTAEQKKAYETSSTQANAQATPTAATEHAKMLGSAAATATATATPAIATATGTAIAAGTAAGATAAAPSVRKSLGDGFSGAVADPLVTGPVTQTGADLAALMLAGFTAAGIAGLPAAVQALFQGLQSAESAAAPATFPNRRNVDDTGPLGSSSSSGGGFAAPLEGFHRLNQGFRPGSGEEPNHAGFDLNATVGVDRVHAIADGVVVFAGWDRGDQSFRNAVIFGKSVREHGVGFGLHVKIQHDIGSRRLVSIYGHMSSLQVSVGQRVSKGQVIGIAGTTGNSSGGHLHFQVDDVTGGKPIADSSAVNPAQFLPALLGGVGGGAVPEPVLPAGLGATPTDKIAVARGLIHQLIGLVKDSGGDFKVVVDAFISGATDLAADKIASFSTFAQAQMGIALQALQSVLLAVGGTKPSDLAGIFQSEGLLGGGSAPAAQVETIMQKFMKEMFPDGLPTAIVNGVWAGIDEEKVTAAWAEFFKRHPELQASLDAGTVPFGNIEANAQSAANDAAAQAGAKRIREFALAHQFTPGLADDAGNPVIDTSLTQILNLIRLMPANAKIQDLLDQLTKLQQEHPDDTRFQELFQIVADIAKQNPNINLQDLQGFLFGGQGFEPVNQVDALAQNTDAVDANTAALLGAKDVSQIEVWKALLQEYRKSSPAVAATAAAAQATAANTGQTAANTNPDLSGNQFLPGGSAAGPAGSAGSVAAGDTRTDAQRAIDDAKARLSRAEEKVQAIQNDLEAAVLAGHQALADRLKAQLAAAEADRDKAKADLAALDPSLGADQKERDDNIARRAQFTLEKYKRKLDEDRARGDEAAVREDEGRIKRAEDDLDRVAQRAAAAAAARTGTETGTKTGTDTGTTPEDVAKAIQDEIDRLAGQVGTKQPDTGVQASPVTLPVDLNGTAVDEGLLDAHNRKLEAGKNAEDRLRREIEEARRRGDEKEVARLKKLLDQAETYDEKLQGIIDREAAAIAEAKRQQQQQQQQLGDEANADADAEAARRKRLARGSGNGSGDNAGSGGSGGSGGVQSQTFSPTYNIFDSNNPHATAAVLQGRQLWDLRQQGERARRR